MQADRGPSFSEVAEVGCVIIWLFTFTGSNLTVQTWGTMGYHHGCSILSTCFTLTPAKLFSCH